MIQTNFEPYCWDGCGRPATHERLGEATVGPKQVPIVELVCEDHAGPTPIKRKELS